MLCCLSDAHPPEHRQPSLSQGSVPLSLLLPSQQSVMAQQLEHLKWIQGTTFMVDGFRFQNPRCTKYFLTHFHADHTTGELSWPQWSRSHYRAGCGKAVQDVSSCAAASATQKVRAVPLDASGPGCLWALQLLPRSGNSTHCCTDCNWLYCCWDVSFKTCLLCSLFS